MSKDMVLELFLERKQAEELLASPGALAICRERLRHIKGEGWTAEHDQKWTGGQLAWAAVCYAAPAEIRARFINRTNCGCRTSDECNHFEEEWREPWPFAPEWDKRSVKDKIRKLEIAGAFIAAEIDRMVADEEREENSEAFATHG